MAKSFVFAKNKLSNGLKGYLISRALVQGCSILGDTGTPLPPKLKLVLVRKSVSVEKSVSVKIGNLTKSGIGMLFLLEEKIGIGIGMLFTSQTWYW